MSWDEITPCGWLRDAMPVGLVLMEFFSASGFVCEGTNSRAKVEEIALYNIPYEVPDGIVGEVLDTDIPGDWCLEAGEISTPPREN